jgi:hypothetical protein
MMSLNISMLGDYMHASRIYLTESEIQHNKKYIGKMNTLTYTLKLTMRAGWNRHYTSNEKTATFPLWIFHLYVATLQQQLHIECISSRWYHISEHVMNSVVKGCSEQRSYWTTGSASSEYLSQITKGMFGLV